MSEYRTRTGRTLTDEDIDAIADHLEVSLKSFTDALVDLDRRVRIMVWLVASDLSPYWRHDKIDGSSLSD